jgi:hypothetical protein
MLIARLEEEFPWAWAEVVEGTKGYCATLCVESPSYTVDSTSIIDKYGPFKIWACYGIGFVIEIGSVTL